MIPISLYRLFATRTELHLLLMPKQLNHRIKLYYAIKLLMKYEIFNRKFPDSVPLIERFFTWALFEVVSTPGEDKRAETENMIRDVKDRPILRAALVSKVDILITGDKDFLESGVKNPQIVTAAEFISDF